MEGKKVWYAVEAIVNSAMSPQAMSKFTHESAESPSQESPSMLVNRRYE